MQVLRLALRGVCVVMAVGWFGAIGVYAQAPSMPAARALEESEIPADYVIGAEDVLAVVFWRDADMTADVVVRPDGKITLPLINDVQASGLTPEELGTRVTEAASRFLESPNVMVRVVEINSRKVFITGMVANPSNYPLTGPTTVLQLIATAGGLLEFAKAQDIRIVRTEGDRQVAYRFNYNQVREGKNLQQNIGLKPGDTVIVP